MGRIDEICTAKKILLCDLCGRQITVGEKYHRQIYKDEDDAGIRYLHEHCNDALEEYIHENVKDIIATIKRGSAEYESQEEYEIDVLLKMMWTIYNAPSIVEDSQTSNGKEGE